MLSPSCMLRGQLMLHDSDAEVNLVLHDCDAHAQQSHSTCNRDVLINALPGAGWQTGSLRCQQCRQLLPLGVVYEPICRL